MKKNANSFRRGSRSSVSARPLSHSPYLFLHLQRLRKGSWEVARPDGRDGRDGDEAGAMVMPRAGGGGGSQVGLGGGDHGHGGGGRMRRRKPA